MPVRFDSPRRLAPALLAIIVAFLLVFTATPAFGVIDSNDEPSPTETLPHTNDLEAPVLAESEPREDSPEVTEEPDSQDSPGDEAAPDAAALETESEPASEDAVMPLAATNGDRVEVTCYVPDQDLTCSETLLNQLVTEAGTTPTRIILGSTATYLTKTLTIPQGADIELVNHPRAPWGTPESALSREDGFTGVVIRVDKGASLTMSNHPDGGEIDIRARGPWVSTPTHLVQVNGTFIMNGGRIWESRNLGRDYTGAVTVSGPESYFELNGGTIDDNQRPLSGNSQNGAANVAVNDQGTMVMNGGVIKNGTAQLNSGNYGEAGGIGLYNGAHLVMNGGEISGNRGFGGGVHLWEWDWSLSNLQKTSLEQRVTFEMNGGMIKSNKAAFGGGGVAVFGNGVFTMRGGEIINNEAPNGGGVNAMDLYVWGTASDYRETAGDGMNSGLGTEGWSEISPGGFIMEGGRIAGNTSRRTGGGINVVSNGVLLKGGVIEDNYSRGQGGGIYVATKSYTLQLENAVVTNNEANYIGGGMWLCPTGSTKIHVTDGGAFFGNSATTYGDDLAHDNLGTVGSYESIFDNRMLGLGDVNYFKDGGAGVEGRFDADNPGREQVFQGDVEESAQDSDKDYYTKLYQLGLRSVTNEEGRTAATNYGKLFIQNNEAYRGGGIGSNGGVVFGYPEPVDIPIQKVWKDESVLAGDPIDQTPESVTFQLFATVTANDGTKQRINAGEPVEVTADTDWSHTWVDLPTRLGPTKTYPEQSVSYDVEEVSVPGYRTMTSLSVYEGEYNFTVTNQRLVTDLDVRKEWKTPAGAVQSEDLPESIELQLVSFPVSNPESENNIGDPVTVTPDEYGDWFYRFEDLPTHINGDEVDYTVRETFLTGYSGTVGDTITDADGYKSVTITNSQVPTSLTVNKEWIGLDGEPLTEGLPEAIELQLVRLNEGNPVEVGSPVTVEPAADGSWTHTFTLLPKYSGTDLIEYSVVETEIPGFTSDVGESDPVATHPSLTLTNTQVPTEVEVTKTWTDHTGEATTSGLPESVTVQLIRHDGDTTVEIGEPVELSMTNRWTHTFTNLPLYVGGELADYDVAEIDAPEGFTSTSSREYNEEDSRTVVSLENSAEATELDVTKTWSRSDGEPLTEGLPESIQIQLLRNGQHVGAPVTISPDADGNWAYTFTDLAKYVDGDIAEYTVVEVPVPGFESEVGDVEDGRVEVTNTQTTTSVDVVKTWSDHTGGPATDNLPQTIEIQLVRVVDGEYVPVGDPVEMKPNTDGEWLYTFADLPAYVDGDQAAYSVIELNVPEGFVSTESRQGTDDGTTVSLENSLQPTSIDVTKTWTGVEGEPLATGLPASIELQLMRVVDGENQPVGTPVTVTADETGNWGYSFTDLAMYFDGQLAQYTVVETPVDGFTSTVSDTVDGAITVTNTAESTTLVVDKTWIGVDGEPQTEDLPASITVQLVRLTGEDAVNIGEPVEITAEAGWTHTFTGLPKYVDGQLAQYSVRETPVVGYDNEVAPPVVSETGTYVAITNTATTTSLSVDKVWLGADGHELDGDTPESITVQLVRLTGEDTVNVGQPVTITAADGWTHTFSHLAEYVDGQLAQYSVVEAPLAGYSSSLATAADGRITITNTADTTSVTVDKQWIGADGSELTEGLPSSIEIQLVRLDGHDTIPVGAPVSISDVDGQWTYTFTGLDAYVDGVAAIYSVIESPVPGFTSDGVMRDTENGYLYTLVNTQETTTLTLDKSWDVSDGTVLPQSISFQLMRFDGEEQVPVGDLVTVTPDGTTWTYTFTQLPLYVDGELAQYTVMEAPLEGFTATVGETSTTEHGYRVEVTNTEVPPTPPEEPTPDPEPEPSTPPEEPTPDPEPEPSTPPEEPTPDPEPEPSTPPEEPTPDPEPSTPSEEPTEEPSTPPEKPKQPLLAKTGVQASGLAGMGLALLLAGAWLRRRRA